MARPRKQTDLERQLLSVAQRMTTEVAAVVKQHIGGEISRIISASINGISVATDGSGRRRRAGPSEELLDTVLETIKRSPGLRSEELYQKIKQPSDQVKAALARLREHKKVKTSGRRRATTYRAA
jgi:hypothetical protein